MSSVIQACALSRYYYLTTRTLINGEPIRPAWFEGWFDWGLQHSHDAGLVSVAEILLAAAVLWFMRRRKGEAKERC